MTESHEERDSRFWLRVLVWGLVAWALFWVTGIISLVRYRATAARPDLARLVSAPEPNAPEAGKSEVGMVPPRTGHPAR